MLSFYVVLIYAAIIAGVYLVISEFRKLEAYYSSLYGERVGKLDGGVQNLKNQDDRIGFDNSRLERKILEIGSLYEMTRGMSGTLVSLEIFEVLAKFLKEGFIFKDCKLILISRKDPEKIDKVYHIDRISGPKTKKIYTTKSKVHSIEPDHLDVKLLTHMKQAREVIRVDSFSKVLDREKQYLPYDAKSFLAVPIIVEDKLTGIISALDLSPELFDNFLILSRQLMLEMRKVELYGRVQELAITDGLTGAYVRRHFLGRMEEELKRSRRHKFSVSFLMLDIDHFKNINDTYGHLVGDALLCRIVNILNDNMRQIDLVARYGGEEFSILLPETGKDEARLVAERIRKAVSEQRFKVYDEFTDVSISIGISSFPDDAKTKDELIESADKALYRAKHEGRNRVGLAE